MSALYHPHHRNKPKIKDDDRCNKKLGIITDWDRFTTAHHHRATWEDPERNVAAGRMVTSWATCVTPNAASSGPLAVSPSSTTSSSKPIFFLTSRTSHATWILLLDIEYTYNWYYMLLEHSYDYSRWYCQILYSYLATYSVLQKLLRKYHGWG